MSKCDVCHNELARQLRVERLENMRLRSQLADLRLPPGSVVVRPLAEGATDTTPLKAPPNLFHILGKIMDKHPLTNNNENDGRCVWPARWNELSEWATTVKTDSLGQLKDEMFAIARANPERDYLRMWRALELWREKERV